MQIKFGYSSVPWTSEKCWSEMDMGDGVNPSESNAAGARRKLEQTGMGIGCDEVSPPLEMMCPSSASIVVGESRLKLNTVGTVLLLLLLLSSKAFVVVSMLLSSPLFVFPAKKRRRRSESPGEVFAVTSSETAGVEGSSLKMSLVRPSRDCELIQF